MDQGLPHVKHVLQPFSHLTGFIENSFIHERILLDRQAKIETNEIDSREMIVLVVFFLL